MTDGRSSHEERGLKFEQWQRCLLVQRSLLSRGAWIEIKRNRRDSSTAAVAPLTRSVDWNYHAIYCTMYWFVAPLTRSVDWNAQMSQVLEVASVAPITRSVDWNSRLRQARYWKVTSLLSRGAWIEIGFENKAVCKLVRSLLSRGAWIEILRI